MTPAVLPLALSLSSSFEKIGAIAAFAALVGIALMSLLAFAQARELKRLREWAGRAPERAAEQEQRVGAQAAAARLQQPIPGAVAPVRQVPRTTPLNVRPVAAPGQPGSRPARLNPGQSNRGRPNLGQPSPGRSSPGRLRRLRRPRRRSPLPLGLPPPPAPLPPRGVPRCSPGRALPSRARVPPNPAVRFPRPPRPSQRRRRHLA